MDNNHLLCIMNSVYNNVNVAERHLYRPNKGSFAEFSLLFGFLLHIGFKMVNRVSDFIDFIQKDIKLTTSKFRKSKQCSTSQQLGHVMNYIMNGNTADSQ